MREVTTFTPRDFEMCDHWENVLFQEYSCSKD